MMNNQKKHERFVRKLLLKGIKVKPLEEYIDTKTKIKFLCVCENEFYTLPFTILRGDLCGCGKGRKNKTHDEYLEELIKKNIKVFPKETYIDAHVNIFHECVCGNVWKSSPSNVLKNNLCGCKSGGKLTNDMYLQQLKEKNIEIVPLEEYKGSKTKILHKCFCGNSWRVIPNAILLQHSSSCGCIQSIGNKTIHNYLENNKYIFKKEITFPDLKGIRYDKSRLRYDFGIYKEGILFCLVEYHGRQHFELQPYWHRTKGEFKKSQTRDKLKREYARNKKIPLIEIRFDDEDTIGILNKSLNDLGYFDLFNCIV